MLANGARNIADLDLFPLPAISYAKTGIPYLRAQQTELDYLRMWFSASFMRDHWLPAVKRSMKTQKDTSATSTASHRHEPKEDELWRHFAIYWMHHLKVSNQILPQYAALTEKVKPLIGKERRKILNAACEFSDQTLKELYNCFNKVAPTLIFCGTAVTIDETLIAYYGQDGKLAGVFRRIPEKPHQKGLIQYRAVVYMHHSRRRATVSLLPILPQRHYTPSQAATELLRLVLPNCRAGVHAFLDSGFATAEIFRALPTMGVTYSICIKPPFVGGLSVLHAAATDGLLPQHTRTYEYNNQILQVISKAANADHAQPYITSVVTTGYKTSASNQVRHKRIGPYPAAVNIWEKFTLAELHHKYPGHEHLNTAEAIIKEVLGWDVLAPPPNLQQQQVWSVEGLESMSKKQLLAISRSLSGCRASARSSVESLVEDITLHHPALQRYTSERRQESVTTADLLNLRDELGLQCSPSHIIIDNYDRFKGAVDLANEDIYRYITLSHHGNFRRVLSWCVVHALVLNAWASHDEYLLHQATITNPNATTEYLHSLRQPFPVFIMRAIEQLIAE